METVYRDYAPKGVKFYYIYKSLAHPENNGYVRPYTLQDRLKHIQEAKRRLGTQIPWICDTMKNDVKHALGDRPNSEFIIDPKGIIIVKRSWSNPSQLRSDLEKLVGPVARPTTVADLDLKQEVRPKPAASGVVPRIELPGRMQPLVIKPGKSEHPYYVKLRAEGDASLLRGGKGTLYLGFRLDPLYDVHWNNLADPIRWRIEAPPGVTVTPAKGEGPKVSVEADVDPREFLVRVDAGNARQPKLELSVSYVVCNDAEGWCKTIEQKYVVELAVDRDGGWKMQRRRQPARDQLFAALDADSDGILSAKEIERIPQVLARFDKNKDGKLTASELPGLAARPGFPPNSIAARLKAMDRNGDGRLTSDEIPPPMRQRLLQRGDRNGDGVIDANELQQMLQRLSGRRPQVGPPFRR